MYLEGHPNLTDEFDLLYVRGVHGWSNLHVVTGDAQTVARITHIFSDSMQELSALCCALLRGEPRCMARLPDEPGVTVVTASNYDDQRHIARIALWACRSWDDIPPCGERGRHGSTIRGLVIPSI
jgi:hypothetical protein